MTTDDYCFACGMKNPIGLKLQFEEKDGWTHFKTTLNEEYQGWSEIAHGGIVCTLLDEVMVWAAYIKGIEAVTGEITVRFRNPAPIGLEIEGRARIVGERGKVILTEGELVSCGKILAQGKAKLLRI
ncbi:MAG TPA: PaaI family thioesterase [bacterium (Candidatus Stahlbacteria)]|nr:PaaI family thioesterase [Candidatus Stahlbacteria bacterium]